MNIVCKSTDPIADSIDPMNKVGAVDYQKILYYDKCGIH